MVSYGVLLLPMWKQLLQKRDKEIADNSNSVSLLETTITGDNYYWWQPVKTKCPFQNERLKSTIPDAHWQRFGMILPSSLYKRFILTIQLQSCSH